MQLLQVRSPTFNFPGVMFLMNDWSAFFFICPVLLCFFSVFLGFSKGRKGGRKEGRNKGRMEGWKEGSKQGRKEEPSPNLHVFWSQIENQVDMNPK